MSDLWEPTKEWDGEDAFIIGGGPSLKNFDFSFLAGKNVIGCNDAFRLGAEIVSICIFGDHSWWQRNKWKLEEFPGRIVTNAPTVLNFNLPNIHKMNRSRDGFHTGTTLGWNYSTGAAAINLAVNLGANRVFLLGYDMCKEGDTSHWHSYNPTTSIHASSFKRFIQGFETLSKALPPEVKIYNVTDGRSGLHTFERIDFPTMKEMLWEEEVCEA